jgi:hypothetical protein
MCGFAVVRKVSFLVPIKGCCSFTDWESEHALHSPKSAHDAEQAYCSLFTVPVR